MIPDYFKNLNFILFESEFWQNVIIGCGNVIDNSIPFVHQLLDIDITKHALSRGITQRIYENDSDYSLRIKYAYNFWKSAGTEQSIIKCLNSYKINGNIQVGNNEKWAEYYFIFPMVLDDFTNFYKFLNELYEIIPARSKLMGVKRRFREYQFSLS